MLPIVQSDGAFRYVAYGRAPQDAVFHAVRFAPTEDELDEEPDEDADEDEDDEDPPDEDDDPKQDGE